MKETIILAPGANGSEILRSLAIHGVNTFNMKIMGSAELARFAFMRSGISLICDFLDSKEEVSFFAEPVRSQEYFAGVGLSDVQEVARTIRTMRLLVCEKDEDEIIPQILQEGIFTTKNQALINVYQTFRKKCKDGNILDTVSMIRKAAYECSPLGAECLSLSEYPLKPLEKKLLDTLSDGNSKEISLQDLYHCQSGNIHISEYRNCYGAPNEVESVLDTIYRGMTMDHCICAVTDPASYAQLFFDQTLLHDIPVTFGTGIPIANANPAKLLQLYGAWCGAGFFGVDSLNAMIGSNVFDRAKFAGILQDSAEKLKDSVKGNTDEFKWKDFWDTLGMLRLTNSKAVNEKRLANLTSVEGKDYVYLPVLKAASEELSLPVWEFIGKYAGIRKGSSTNAEKLLMKLDKAASSAITSELVVLFRSAEGVSMDISMDDMIRSILTMMVCNESAREGCLHITTISGALSVVRENLFVLGLDANHFPGSPKENYLLLDADLKLFGKEAEKLLSGARIMEKKESFDSLIGLYSCLGSRIYLSYAGLNVSDLKKANASSVLFETYKREHGAHASTDELEKEIRKVTYFAPTISKTREIGKAYNEKLLVQLDDIAEKKELTVDTAWMLNKAWSPSALGIYFQCPRRFCLQHICGIPEPEETDPFVVINPKQEGTLAHHMMEVLANSDMDKQTFLDQCDQEFEQFLKTNPPLIAEGTDAVKTTFLEMMETAFEMDPHRQVELKEEDVSCRHESGVLIHGFPDRMEKAEDGSYQIVDFKTGRTVRHQQNDAESCLQALIYAYIMQTKGYQVSGCEYRYIRLGNTVSCKYDKDMQDQLYMMLDEFKTALEKGDFPCAQDPQSKDDPDPCKYCTYMSICGKTPDTEEGGE